MNENVGDVLCTLVYYILFNVPRYIKMKLKTIKKHIFSFPKKRHMFIQFIIEKF